MKNTFTLLLTLLITHFAVAQNALDSLIGANKKTFSMTSNVYTGDGWDQIIDQVKAADHLLIGEDHFTNETPQFVKAITDQKGFDNFYIEVDPYSTAIIEHSVKEMSASERQQFNQDYKDLFSFYALQPEYDLLNDLVNAGTKLYGSDQIVMYADRLVFQNLAKKTKNADAKQIYQEVIAKSKAHLDKFYKNPQNPMYLITPEFSEKMNVLKELDLSDEENEVIDAALTSVDIYQSRSHGKRIQLLKKHLMENYPHWTEGSTLFKYGAVHLPKGESLLRIYDIGNLVSNIAEAHGQKTLHVMVVGQSGEQGAPFKVFPPQPVNTAKGPLKSLQPFIDTDQKDWVVYDLKTINKAIRKGKLNIDDVMLERVIKGYDLLVVIPEVTAAKFGE